MAKKTRRGRTEYDVSPEKFIRVWQQSTSVDDVATKLGMPKPIILARKSNYTALGIKLKKMPRKSREHGLDVNALNAMIEELDRSGKNPTAGNMAPNHDPSVGEDNMNKGIAGSEGGEKTGG